MSGREVRLDKAGSSLFNAAEIENGSGTTCSSQQMADSTSRQHGRGVRTGTGDPVGPRYRLVFAVQRFFEFGGLQRDLQRIAIACANRGHDVHVVTGQWEGARPESLSVHLVDVPGRTNHGRCEAFGRMAQRFVESREIDCLVGFNKMAGLDVCWCGDPCLAAKLREEKALPVRWLPRYRTYLRLEETVFGRDGDAELLILTESEQERIAQQYGTADDRMHLLPAGIDSTRFGPGAAGGEASIRRELGIDSTSLMVLSVGSSFRTKGVDRSLRAIARLPKTTRRLTEFVVVGNGDQRRFRRLAERLSIGDRVHFTGGRDDVADFYRAADVLLHPARTETAGHILLEAMICGLPVIVTENCGYAFHVRRAGAGLLCPHPFGQRRLDQLLAGALCDSDRDHWKKNALDYCEQTDLHSMVDRAADVIVARAERNRFDGSLQELRRAS